MTDVGVTREAEGEGGAADTAYLTLSGTAVASRALVVRLGRAAWLARLVYNACIDPRVAFADGVAHRLAEAAARRAKLPAPPPPVRSDGFLPVPDEAETRRRLTGLLQAHPKLREFPRSILDKAVDDACRARRRHVVDVVAAKAAGRKPPTLHHRSAADGWSITTADFMLLRIGDGPARREPTRRSAKATPDTLRQDRRNARRRENEEIFREAAWAEGKRRCGWNEDKVAFHLGRRAKRQRADRERQGELERERREAVVAARASGAPRKVRRDSPSAVVGERRLKADVLGLRRFRVDLGMPIPEGATAISLCLVKPAWRGAKLEVRLALSMPAARPLHDEDATRARLHEVARALPDGATPLAAVEALRATGLLARGEDLGIAHPSCDDRGVTTRPVRLSRADFKAMQAAQASLAHKQGCRHRIEQGEGKKAKVQAGGVTSVPSQVDGVTPAAAPVDDPASVGARRARPRRSRNAQREVETLRSLSHRASERSRTRALQDVAALMRGDPVLVATDPTCMVKPLLAKNGPVERRARREAAEAAGVPPAPAPPRTDGRAPYALTAERERAMRRNLHATRFGFRIARTGLSCARIGAVHATPGHEGTTAGCPACHRVAPKTLGQRRHACPCGLDMPRDQASAIMTLGRAVLSFRDGPDPGGLLAARRQAEAEARARRDRRKAAMAAGAAKARETRRAAAAARHDGGVSSPTQGVVPLGHLGEDKPKRVRNQGRNVRRAVDPHSY